MKIRQKRYNLELEPRKKKLNVSLIVKLAVVVGAIVAAICIGNYAVERANIRSSYLAGKEKITVGVRTDIEPFGFYDASGNIDGFDKDVSETLLRNIFGDDVQIEFKEIWSENAGASIKYGQIDMAAGFIVPGTDKTAGFSLTDPYYTDYAVAVAKGQPVSDGPAFNGLRVGILNSMINVSTMEDYVGATGAECKEILRYYDFESAEIDLNNGVIDVFVLPGKVAGEYFADGGYHVSDGLFEVSYSLMFPSSASSITGVFSNEISKMKSDGTMDNLLQKWSLSD